jgi:hypothetical protein
MCGELLEPQASHWTRTRRPPRALQPPSAQLCAESARILERAVVGTFVFAAVFFYSSLAWMHAYGILFIVVCIQGPTRE